MEKGRVFKNELEQAHYERLKESMHNGLVFAENNTIADQIKDTVAQVTSLMLNQGISPRFTSGGDIWRLASEAFLSEDRKRIEVLIKAVRKRRDSWIIRTRHRYSRQNNAEML